MLCFTACVRSIRDERLVVELTKCTDIAGSMQSVLDALALYVSEDAVFSDDEFDATKRSVVAWLLEQEYTRHVTATLSAPCSPLCLAAAVAATSKADLARCVKERFSVLLSPDQSMLCCAVPVSSVKAVCSSLRACGRPSVEEVTLVEDWMLSRFSQAGGSGASGSRPAQRRTSSAGAGDVSAAAVEHALRAEPIAPVHPLFAASRSRAGSRESTFSRCDSVMCDVEEGPSSWLHMPTSGDVVKGVVGVATLAVFAWGLSKLRRDKR